MHERGTADPDGPAGDLGSGDLGSGGVGTGGVGSGGVGTGGVGTGRVGTGRVGTGLVDGVRTLVLSGPPAPGPDDGLPPAVTAPAGARAHLLFRVGLVDETLADLGVTLLALRLAAEALPPTVATHVRVGPTTSSIELRAGAAELGPALARFTREVADPDPAALERVRERLLAEQDAGLLDRAVLPAGAGEHFGARGFGVLGYRCVALPGLSAADVRGWARRRLVAENAVLLTEGLDRSAVDLGLPRGEPCAEPSPEGFAPVVTGPTHVVGQDIALSFPAPRSWAARVALGLLVEVAADRLRPVAVSTRSCFVPLSRTRALVSIAVLPLPDREQECVDGLVAAFRDAAAEVPLHALAAAQARFAAAGDLTAEAVADEVALELLLDGELGDAGSPARALEVDAEQVRAVLAAGARAVVVAAPLPPSGPGWRRPRPVVPRLSRGTTFVSVSARRRRVVLSPHGVLLDGVGDPGAGALWGDVELVLVRPGGDAVWLFLLDGRILPLAAGDWRGPRRRRDIVGQVLFLVRGLVPVRVEPGPAPTGPVGYPPDHGSRRLVLAAVALWTVPTALIVGIVAVGGPFAWPLLLGYGWALRVTVELHRRARAG